LFSIALIFIPDKGPEYRTVRLNTGHQVATLSWVLTLWKLDMSLLCTIHWTTFVIYRSARE